ncbi:MAG: trigger factor [Elusimicrobia bacterium GWA2_69_24]|nr:MAG: trigger factor [Elusimicrobia bacterium GWA2_69_24]HBL17124.1 trigger factor [Elusimicrobiota bacterium]
MAIWTPSNSTSTKTKKLKAEGCTNSYELEVPRARLQEAAHNALLRLQLQARLPGFRPGKAPMEMVRKHFGERAELEAVDDVIKKVIPEVLTELKLRPVGVPTVDDVKVQPESPLRFTMRVEVAPEFEPKNYKGIALTKKEVVVQETDIEARLQQLQDGNARLDQAAAEALEKTHYAVVDFELTRDGKVIEGGRGKGELVDMSSEQSIEGIVEGLLGSKRAETREFDVKVEGKPTRCKMTVHEIKSKIVPAIDDEFAKDLGCTALEELKTKLRELVVKENSQRTERELQQQLEKALLDANKFDVPPSLAEQQLEYLMERLLGRLGRGGKEKLPAGDLKKLREQMRPQAEDSVRFQFLIAEIAKREKIEVTDDDLKKDLEGQLARAETDEEKRETRELFEKRADDIRALIRERKALALIRDAAKVTTVKS